MTDKKPFNIRPYHKTDHAAVLDVWQQSVLASHDFLKPDDFVLIKQALSALDLSQFNTFCLAADNNIIAFVAVDKQKIEMLFVSPQYFGQGLGKKLVNFAIEKLGADSLDVNEQNSQAVAFYQHCGFRVTGKSETDGMGKNYPLLHMKLKK